LNRLQPRRTERDGASRIAAAARIGLVLLGLAAANSAVAFEFRSVGEAPAILYDGPSLKANKVFVASRGSPLEVVSTLEGWIKVREPSGQLAWVEAAALVAKRTISVSAALVPIRAAPSESSPPVFQAQQGVILELIDASGAWAHVRHRDGLSGYVRASQVWGL
jgi:SH3-like domain-containing protein